MKTEDKIKAWQDRWQPGEPDSLEAELLLESEKELRRLRQFEPSVVLASPEKAALNNAIEAAMFERAVEAYLDYYKWIEELNRRAVHKPKGKYKKTVQVLHSNGLDSREHRALANTRFRRLEGIPAAIKMSARTKAAACIGDELDWCQCDTCKRFRES